MVSHHNWSTVTVIKRNDCSFINIQQLVRIAFDICLNFTLCITLKDWNLDLFLKDFLHSGYKRNLLFLILFSTAHSLFTKMPCLKHIKIVNQKMDALIFILNKLKKKKRKCNKKIKPS